MAISNLTHGPIAVVDTFAGFRVQGMVADRVTTAAQFVSALILMGFLSHFYGYLENPDLAQNLLAG